MMFFSTGSTLGTNLNLLLREGRLKVKKFLKNQLCNRIHPRK